MSCATALLTWVCIIPHAQPGTLQGIARLEFKGTINSSTDLSAVAVVGEWLVVGSDETTSIQVLKPVGNLTFQAESPLPLLDDPAAEGGKEIDIEGMASDGEHIYVVGSHCLARKKVEDDKSREKNLERLSDIKSGKNRHSLFRLKLSDNGTLKGSPESIKISDLLQDHDILGRFKNIPSKENGIDIEGLAIDDGRLYLGFRGPVLTGNWVPILGIKVAEPTLEQSETFYLPLEGLGIRDLLKIKNGFLILAGPVGDGPGAGELYWWNGKDCIPDEGNTKGQVVHLGHIEPPQRDAKAEGLTLLNGDDDHYDILILYDGITNGSPEVFRVQVP